MSSTHTSSSRVLEILAALGEAAHQQVYADSFGALGVYKYAACRWLACVSLAHSTFTAHAKYVVLRLSTLSVPVPRIWLSSPFRDHSFAACLRRHCCSPE